MSTQVTRSKVGGMGEEKKMRKDHGMETHVLALGSDLINLLLCT